MSNNLLTFIVILLFVFNIDSYGREKATTINLKKLNITKGIFLHAIEYDKKGEYAIAEACLKKAIEKKESANYGKACFMLANYYYESRKGIARDLPKAKKYYTQAMTTFVPEAEIGDAQSQYIVGICFKNSTGKRELAFEWLLKSANNGYIDAQVAVSLCLVKGTGVKRDAQTAMTWLKKAVANGNMEAKAYLASYYLNP